jgi:hypothetical protein
MLQQEEFPGAVIAGVILSLIVYLMLSVLRTAIGASLLRPLSRPLSLREFGFGSGVWVTVTGCRRLYGSIRRAPMRSRAQMAAWRACVGSHGPRRAVRDGIVRRWCSECRRKCRICRCRCEPKRASGEWLRVSRVGQPVCSKFARVVADASNPHGLQDVQQPADTAARAAARATWFSFAALFAGAVIALGAGGLGYRHQPPFKEAGGSSSVTRDSRRAGPKWNYSGCAIEVPR